MENNWFQKFGKFSGKYHDGVWFSKVAILESEYCNPTPNITTNSFQDKFVMA